MKLFGYELISKVTNKIGDPCTINTSEEDICNTCCYAVVRSNFCLLGKLRIEKMFNSENLSNEQIIVLIKEEYIRRYCFKQEEMEL